MMKPRSETDVLAAMMGADTRRIDDLVETVGGVKGQVGHLREDVGRVAKGVDDLKDAMVGVARYTVLHEATRADMDKIRIEQIELRKEVNDRLGKIEPVMPGLIESRAYTVKAVVALVGLIGLAVVGLVLKINAVT